LKQRSIKEAMQILDNEFSYNQISIAIATKIHKVIKDVTHNSDPYRMMKEKEMDIAQELYLELLARSEQRSNLYKDDFPNYLKLAAANAIDFLESPALLRGI
jgi:uncharacterized protein with ATP-grasp and redox domains